MKEQKHFNRTNQQSFLKEASLAKLGQRRKPRLRKSSEERPPQPAIIVNGRGAVPASRMRRSQLARWSYDDVHCAIKRACFARDFDIILGLERAGALVAFMMAYEFGRPASTLALSEERLPLPARFKRILLVDDVVGSGQTMEAALKKLRGLAPSATVKTYALVRDGQRGEFEPDYCGVRADQWIRLPWDEREFARGQAIKYRTAYDMDGVVCTDANTWLDGFMLARWPNVWANLRHLFVLPLMRPRQPITIITGRPPQDRWTTLAWLHLWGIKAEVHFNPYRPDHEGAVRWKAECINRLGITRFIESDAKQAEEVRKLCPQLS